MAKTVGILFHATVKTFKPYLISLQTIGFIVSKEKQKYIFFNTENDDLNRSANNVKTVSGITSKIQCMKIGNEHDSALDVIPARHFRLHIRIVEVHFWLHNQLVDFQS